MDYSDAPKILTARLARFRQSTYAELAAGLGPMSGGSTCLESVEGKFDAGGEYCVTITVCWDSKPGGHIRVAGDVTTDERTRVYGLPSLSTANASEDFIMAADGSLIGE